MDSYYSKQSFIDNGTLASGITLPSFTPYELQPTKLYRAFLDDPTYSDVTIRLGNRIVYAHRAVLCRGSKYFTSLLNGRFQVRQMPTTPPHEASQTDFEQQEATSKEIELRGDDPNAMLALLRFLYGLPYDAEANGKWVSSLELHASVYVVANKYQLGPLQEAVAKNMRKIITSKTYTNKVGYLQHCDTFKNSDDFFGALEVILEVTTTGDTLARKVLLDFLIQNIDFFRKQKEFQSLIADRPELAVELITHPDLESEAEGFWMCFAEDCGINIPSCGSCKFLFESHFLRRYRHDDLWECPVCKFVGKPHCVDCREEITWVPDSACKQAEQESGNGEQNDMDLDDTMGVDTEDDI